MANGNEILSQVYDGGAARNLVLNRFVPTVFLALGGSGKEVLIRLRKRFADSGRADPPYAGFLFIDTDSQAFVPNDAAIDDYAEVQARPSEQVSCTITESEFNRVFDGLEHRVDSAHLSWLKPRMRGIGAQALVNGAGTHRQFGRLAFFLHYRQICEQIEAKIKAVLLYAAQNPMTVEHDRVEVVLVTSLAGGTGSGMFLDAAYLVRDILEHADYHNLASKYVTIISFLPALWQKDQPGLFPRLQQNTYAALLELEYYGTPRTGDELFLGDDIGQSADRLRSGFHVTWDGQDRYLRGPAWGSCFLIDNINDLAPNAPLPREEVFQMVADYLFLDFEQHGFAVRKRSARSNLVQYKDRWHATWVRRGGGSPRHTVLINTDVVYGTQNGCGFSTFGLAEIYFDLDKLYRAAGYRLAWHLIRARWIGAAQRCTDEDYRGWVRGDLGEARSRPDQPKPPSFRTEALIRRLLTGPQQCWLDVLEADLARLSTVPAAQGLAALRAALVAHEGNLADPDGPALQTVRQNLTLLRGTPKGLGLLRERLRWLVCDHLSEHGVAPTLHLLGLYQQALAQVRAELAGMAPATMSPEALPRLEEAGKVGRFVRGRARQIEYPRARAAVAGFLPQKYRWVTAVMAEPNRDQASPGDPVSLLAGLNRYIGAAGQRTGPELTALGTLFDLCTQARGYLDHMVNQLEDRFKKAYKEDDQDIKRKRSLSAGWDERKYDEKINEALVHDVDNVGPGAGGPAPFTFDWARFEALVLERLRAAGAPPEIHTRADFFVHWLQHEKNPGDQSRVAERLADACREVLKAAGLDLNDVEKGNAVDLLMTKDGAEKKSQIDRLVVTSAPYLPMLGHQTIAALTPAYSNLYGHKPGEHQPNTSKGGNAAAIAAMVSQAAATSTPGTGGQVTAVLPAEDSSLLLVREMAGFPLQYYSRLVPLQQAYRSTATYTHSNDECHIDYHEAWRDLPEIRPIDIVTYTRIREHIDHVLYALMLGVIVWEEDEFRVKVPNRLGGPPDTFSLGIHLHRLIKFACDDESIRNHLIYRWTEWTGQATTKHWAGLLASALKTFHGVNNKVIYLDHGQQQAPPVRNCFEALAERIRQRLEQAPDGRLWGALLLQSTGDGDGDGNGNGNGQGKPDPGGFTPASFLEEVARKCLRQVRPNLPIFQLQSAKVTTLELPPAPDLVAS